MKELKLERDLAGGFLEFMEAEGRPACRLEAWYWACVWPSR